MLRGRAFGVQRFFPFPPGIQTRHAFFCFVLWSLPGHIFSQEVTATAREFYQNAASATEVEQKIRFLERALQQSPQYLEAKLELGKTLVQIGKYDQARAHLESALDIDPKNAEVWYWKGRAYQALGDTTIAVRSYQRALKWNPNFSEARTSLKKFENQPKLKAFYQNAEQARQAGDWRSAAESYQKILNEESDFDDAATKLKLVENKITAEDLANSAEKMRQRQQFDEAIGKLDQAIALDNDRAFEFKEQIRKIASEKRLEENRTPAQILRQPSKEETTAVAAAKDSSTLPKTAVTAKDSLSRQPAKMLAENPQKNSPLKWVAAVSAIILLTFTFIFWQKNRLKPQKTSPRQSLPAADEMLSSSPVVNDVEKSAPWRQTSRQAGDVSPPKFERYRLQEELGRGGMGHVYKAYDLKLERPVALKLIRLDNTTDIQEAEERIARFRREAKAIARLNHPNIVSLYDYDEADGMLYMIMEYVEGRSVEQMLQAKRQLGARLAVRIIKQACWALEYAHKNGIIHRDIKPSNIMVTSEDLVKVVDFGVAKMLGATNSQMNTLTGMRLGSPFYMSPEQIEALKLDPRSDIFSLGAVFYEMLASQKPFTINEGNNLSSLFYAILHADPPKLKTVSPQLEIIVRKMLAKDREQRFKKAREVIEALHVVVG